MNGNFVRINYVINARNLSSGDINKLLVWLKLKQHVFY